MRGLPIFALVVCVLLGARAESERFDRAVPVWVRGRAEVMNDMVGFRGDFVAKSGCACRVRVTGSTVYRLFVNGAFAGYGPARGPKGRFRVDEWDVSRLAHSGTNAVAIEVSGYNVDNYYYSRQPSFVQAEILVDGQAVTSTPEGFCAVQLPRVRKCSRFSGQRGFGEKWTIERAAYDWRTKPVPATLPLERRPDVRLLPRIAPYPDFGTIVPTAAFKTRIEYDPSAKVVEAGFVEHRTWDGKPSPVGGYRKEELDANICYENRRVKTVSAKPAAGTAAELVATDGVIFDVGRNSTGFFGMRVAVRKPGRMGFAFDEVLTDGTVSSTRMKVANVVMYDFREPGIYRIENFEPNTFRWLHAYALEGDFRIECPFVREYKSPAANGFRFDCGDAELKAIFEAARETFAQNAVDVFTDCPGRERAGWLCDSWFTARTSHLLTRSLDLEELFLSNYALADGFPDIDSGMLPMCYPADFASGRYIPNWAMWLVLELDDYRRRGGKEELIARLRPRLLDLVGFLRRFRNADGLLERLPSWVFVEWSRSNALVQDVNYPSNMLWAETLDAMNRLYGLPELSEEARRVRDTVNRQSWTGSWYCDNAVRQKDGSLKLSGECTETCQYYAFMFGTATQTSRPELWRRLVSEFGPGRFDPNDRKRLIRYPEIWPSNAFIGNYLRLELLSKAGLGEQVVREIRGYFSYMTEKTGTLWEHDAASASCCHGFASYVAVLLSRHAMACLGNK